MKLRKRRKAQMFIITMVFLIGFIFAVQQNLLQYSIIDASKYFAENDNYLLQNIRNMFNQTLQEGDDCLVTNQSMWDIRNYLNTQIFRGGYILELNYTLDCSYWDSQSPTPLNVTIKLIGEKTETIANFGIYRPCSETAGSTTVTDVYGNTIEYDAGPWGPRVEGTYVVDDSTKIIYIVPYNQTVEPICNPVFEDCELSEISVSLYNADQMTGEKLGYTTVDGQGGGPNLMGVTVIFFDTFAPARAYIDGETLCTV